MTPNANLAPPPAQPNWFSRNWKWLLPVGCIVPMMCCGVFGAVAYFGASKMIQGSPVFLSAMVKANANAEVEATLGTPLSPGFGINGSMKEENGKGMADFSMPVEGPKGKGTLVVKARGNGGDWDYETLVIEAGGKRIDLLAAERAAPPPDDLAPPEDATPPDEEPADEPAKEE